MSRTLSQIIGNKVFRFLLWSGALLLVPAALVFGCQADPTALFADAGSAASVAVVGAVNLLLIIVSCFLLMRLNNRYALMQHRTPLPAMLLLIFDCCNPDIVGRLNTGLLLTPVFLLILYNLYATYQNDDRPRAYDMGLLIAAGSLLWPPFLWLGLPFLAAFLYMRTFNVRIAAALVSGVLTVVWIAFCGDLLFGFSLLPDFRAMTAFSSFESGLPGRLDDMDYLLPTALIGLFCCIAGTYFTTNHKIRIWWYKRFTVLLTLFLLLLALLDTADLDNYLPLLNATAALSVAHFFLHSRNRSLPYLFYILIAGYLTLYVWNLSNC